MIAIYILIIEIKLVNIEFDEKRILKLAKLVR